MHVRVCFMHEAARQATIASLVFVFPAALLLVNMAKDLYEDRRMADLDRELNDREVSFFGG